MITPFPEKRMIDAAEELIFWLQKKADSSIGTVFDTEKGYWMQDQALNLRAILFKLQEMRKMAARYEFWRKYYNGKFVIVILPNNTSRLSFDALLPVIQPAGPDYEAKVDAAIDEAITNNGTRYKP